MYHFFQFIILFVREYSFWLPLLTAWWMESGDNLAVQALSFGCDSSLSQAAFGLPVAVLV